MNMNPYHPSDDYRWQDRVPSGKEFRFDLIVMAAFAAACIVLNVGSISLDGIVWPQASPSIPIAFAEPPSETAASPVSRESLCRAIRKST
jgi:hypothetical protein